MRNALVGLAALAAAGIATYWWQSGDDTPAVAHDDDLVHDRLWIDHVPRSERDTIQIFATLTSESLGIFQATSAWKGAHELFRFEGHDHELRLVFPQNGDRERVHARATRCDKQGMDYCLELSGSRRGVKKYYSVEGWEIGNLADAKALAAKLAPAATARPATRK